MAKASGQGVGKAQRPAGEAMDDLDADLKEAEAVRNGWKPVGDLLIDSLQDHIEKTTGSASLPPDKGF